MINYTDHLKQSIAIRIACPEPEQGIIIVITLLREYLVECNYRLSSHNKLFKTDNVNDVKHLFTMLSNIIVQKY